MEMVSGGWSSVIVELLTGFASTQYIKVSHCDKQSAHQQIKKVAHRCVISTATDQGIKH